MTYGDNITGVYTLCLKCVYCDEEAMRDDDSRQDAIKYMREVGWVINTRDDTCRCPEHAEPAKWREFGLLLLLFVVCGVMMRLGG